METKPKQRSAEQEVQAEGAARWRLLATSGVSLEQAALEIGVTRDGGRAARVGARHGRPVQVCRADSR